MESSINRNKAIFEALKGKTIADVVYSDLRDGEDFVTLILEDGSKVTLHSEAPNKQDITWIRAETK